MFKVKRRRKVICGVDCRSESKDNEVRVGLQLNTQSLNRKLKSVNKE
jgi:hypothetical protein